MARTFVIFSLCVGAIPVAVFAQERGKDSAEQKRLSGWQRMFRQQASEYRIICAQEGATEVAAELLRKPIMRWSQPVRGGDTGAIFLWVRDGRPVTIGMIFIFPHRRGGQVVAHELQSLSERPLVATWRRRRWTPPEDAVTWKSLRGAPPADSPRRRLLQMRELARQFEAETRGDGNSWQLRLLPRPLYRYDLTSAAERRTASPTRTEGAASESSAAGFDNSSLLDGAIFGFVQGTDLETVLLLEARRIDGRFQWQYACARMSDYEIEVKHEDKTVWKVPRGKLGDPRGAYYLSTVERREAPPEESAESRPSRSKPPEDSE